MDRVTEYLVVYKLLKCVSFFLFSHFVFCALCLLANCGA